LLNQLKLSMHMLSTYSFRTSALASAFCLIVTVFLAGCASHANTPPIAQNTPGAADLSQKGVETIDEGKFLNILSPYRIDVQQGNFVSSEIMTQLADGMKRKEGMTRDQVRFLLGTPLISDIFHADRWDYVFRLRRGNGEVLTSHVSVFFKGNLASSVDGANLPTEKDYISLIAGKTPIK
jgi:outer membrane protein assembly factor BamE